MVPKNENGNASRMLELTGLDGMHPRRNLELLPYVAGRTEFIQPSTAGNPFNDGSRAFGAAGLDMKWGLTSNLTLSATVNPDFGQVEVDPAVVNLTAFETFFDEKRPFFLEGSQIFNNFGRGGANDFWGFNNSEPQIFYSRRIGRAPQLVASGDYVDAPTATTILGAAKLTGKTSGRWSLGMLQAHHRARKPRARAAPGSAAAPSWSRSRATPWRRVQREVGNRDGPRVPGHVGGPPAGHAGGQGRSQQRRARRRHRRATGSWTVTRSGSITGDIAGSRVAGTTTLDRSAPARAAALLPASRRAARGARSRRARASRGSRAALNLNRNRGDCGASTRRCGPAARAGSRTTSASTAPAIAPARTPSCSCSGNKPRRFSRSRSFWVAKSWTWNYARELQSDNVNMQVQQHVHELLVGGRQRRLPAAACSTTA